MFLTGMALIGAVRLALLFYPFQTIVASLGTLNRKFPRGSGAPQVPLIRAARRLAQAAALCPLPVTCLAEALASKALLARYGHPGELCIGVNKNGRRLEAHAWLECADHVFIGNPAPHGKEYVRLSGLELERFIG